MSSYATAAQASNALFSIEPPPTTWSLPQRIARVRDGNPNFRRGRWSRWRSKTEHHLVSWSRQVPRLVGQLRALGEQRADGTPLVQLAAALERATPFQLGAILDTRPRKGNGPERTAYYVPAAAMDNVRAFIRACRWASRFVALALGGAAHWLRSLVDAGRRLAPRVVRVPQNVTSPDPAVTPERTTEVEPGSWEERAQRLRRLIEADEGRAITPPTT